MNALDETLQQYLAIDILRVEAELRLPPPPRTPVFARETVRPLKVQGDLPSRASTS